MTREIRRLGPTALLMLAIACTGCSQQGSEPSPGDASERVALEFARALAAREYAAAHAMTSREYRRRASAEQLRADFEAIVPTDWGPMGPIEVGQTLTSWPGRQPADLGRVYVSIGGDVYSEAVVVVVASESGEARIRDVEFGRP